MARQRRNSNVSEDSSTLERNNQELGSMYDYLAKIILLGPSGCGKSCLLHRIVKNEWRVLSSQTIGVEFSSKIIKVGTGARRKRIKLQLWDTAGTERFRSVSRSYYRGAAGAVLVYDIASLTSFKALPTFLNDARALASPNLTLLLAGNKVDLTSDEAPQAEDVAGHADESQLGSSPSSGFQSLGTQKTVTLSPEGREVSHSAAAKWASDSDVPVAVEISAYTGEGVNEVFSRLAGMILTKIELGEIDPDDPMSGIQYGDGMAWDDTGSVKSRGTMIDDSSTARRRRKGRPGILNSGLREWEQVFKPDPSRRRRMGGCC